MKNGYFIDEEQLAESEESFTSIFGCLFWLAPAIIGLIILAIVAAVVYLIW